MVKEEIQNTQATDLDQTTVFFYNLNTLQEFDVPHTVDTLAAVSELCDTPSDLFASRHDMLKHMSLHAGIALDTPVYLLDDPEEQFFMYDIIVMPFKFSVFCISESDCNRIREIREKYFSNRLAFCFAG